MIAATGVAGGLVAGLLAVRQSYVFAREESMRWRESMAQDAQRNAQYHGASALRAGQQALTMVQQMPDVSASNRMLSRIQGRDNLEQSIRAEQAVSGRDLSHNQQIRSRRERQHELSERKDEHQDRLVQADKKLAELNERRKDIETRKKNAEGSHAATVNTLNQTKINRQGKQPFEHQGILSNPLGWAGQQMRGYATAAVGGVTDSQATEQNMKVDQSVKAEEARYAHEQTNLKEQENQLDEEALRLGKERQSAAEGILKVTREQVAAAREAAEADQQRVTGAEQSLGMMSLEDQNKMKRVDAKAQRIEEQRAANVAAGKDEWEGVEQMTHEELQAAASFDGPMADTARDQAQRQGQKTGVRTRTKERDKSAQALKDAEAAQKEEDPAQMKIVEEQATENQKLADHIVEGMKKAFSFADLSAKLDKAFEEMKSQFDQWKVKQNSWW